MVRLGIATGSRGPRGEDTVHRGLPPSDQPLLSYPVIRTEGNAAHTPQIVLNPSTSSPVQIRLDRKIETHLPAGTRISPIISRNESSLPSAVPSASSSSSIAMARPHHPGWPKTSRDSGESVIRSQKRSYVEAEDLTEVYENTKYAKEVKWCPVCRSPIHSNTVHHCALAEQHGMSLYARSGQQEKVHDKYNPPDHHTSPIISLHPETIHHSVVGPGEALNFSGRISGLRVPVPSTSPHSTIPSMSCSQVIPREDGSSSTANLSVLRTASAAGPPPLERIDSPRSSVSGMSQASTSQHRSSSERPSQGSPPWSSEGNYNVTSTVPSDSWETPNSLISRLTAGMTSRQKDDAGYRSCPSPTISETSSVSMSSYFSHQDPGPPVNPFNMAHEELLEECSKNAPPPVDARRKNVKMSAGEKSYNALKGKRGRRYTSSESASSDVMQVMDSNLYGSPDSDTEDNSSSGYLDENGRLPDLDTLLKAINMPDLVSYLPDKASIDKFLEPHEIGHINHLIKSVSDAMLTISLPETLYKSKGFTPLDYMDIHLNCVIRHFFFVFKNEDFLNLMMADQIALLDACTLGAIQCTNLYLFNKDAGCWHIPGATHEANHPVIHISDLMQVFPQAFVNKTYELHTIAAKLGFDWPMGVIASCILMYTPLKKIIQEMDKVDMLRNKYVHLLLKYVTWKHGTYNASLLFPEILKLLDALLLHVDDFATITLKLNGEEVIAVEERLATLTLSQMAPYGCQSAKFKEKVASWSTLDCVKLGDIQNRLCMAMHMSMLENLQSTSAHYWASNTVYYGSGASREEPTTITQCKSLPQLMAPSDKDYSDDQAIDRSAFLNQKMLHNPNREMKSISALAHKDLMMLRKFLEEVTNREGTMVVQNIKEKMDSNQIKKIINKLCS